MSTVLVTGGSGFVGSHTIIKLLEQGHTVRATIRSAAREEDVRKMLRAAQCDGQERLSFFVADLEKDAEWAAAVEGCDYVCHIASPFPLAEPKNQDEVVRPALEGTLRILRAAKEHGVKRVVLTSSFAAIGYGQGDRERPFDENDWTADDADVPAYIKSKAVAERAAWKYAKESGLELTVLNPVGIFGPTLNDDLSASVEIVKNMLDGKIPACPRVYFSVVDVRDVADLHVQAMTLPAAAGQRFIIAAAGPIALIDLAKILKAGVPDHASKVPSDELPDAVVRSLAPFKPELKSVIPNLGIKRPLDNSKAKHTFNWTPISTEEAVIASAKSLLGLSGASN